ncbi:SAM and SH3 domain-containing protein 1 [Bagarius yarrelli]|uniref:SAM and SH3 domain-containing protein 1 n=1 Tax=Bagarius yarrelli TaxID=175774 RepID=A0A556TZI9_BAGYA|nr:SAM and SH3 domain-containing protein 1 [Bagarius yarrelli]
MESDTGSGAESAAVGGAQEYSEYYNACFSDVSERVEELRRRHVSQEIEMESLSLSSQVSTPETERKVPLHKSNSEDGSGKWDSKKKNKSFWQNFRKSPKGLTRQSSKGEDIGYVASEITMSDEERIQLMMMVKEKMITVEEALARLKEYERSRQLSSSSDTAECADGSMSSGCASLRVVFPQSREQSDDEQEDSLKFKRLHKLVNSTRRVRKKLIKVDDGKRQGSEDSLSLDVSPSCEDTSALYAGVNKKGTRCTEDSSLSSLTQDQLSVDGDRDSLSTSPSSSSLEAWNSAHRLVKTTANPHSLVRPPASSKGGTEDEPESRKSSLSHGVSMDTVYTHYSLVRPCSQPHRMLVPMDYTKRPPISTWQRSKPDPNYAYSTKHLLYQRSCQKSSSSPPPFSPRGREPYREKGKGSVGVVGTWLCPPKRLRGRTAVSELNITYVVERGLYNPTSRKSERLHLLEDDRDNDRKWASSVDRCTRRVLLRIQQKSVSEEGHRAAEKVTDRLLDETAKGSSPDGIPSTPQSPQPDTDSLEKPKLKAGGSVESLRSSLSGQSSMSGQTVSTTDSSASNRESEHMPTFLFNGYEDLDTFKLLEEEDLDELNIRDPQHRAVLLTAIELLQEYDSSSDPERSALSGSQEKLLCEGRGMAANSPRDSGCYESSENLENGKPCKASRSSRCSSGFEAGRVQSLDFPRLPISNSADELQHQPKKERKFSKHFLPRPIKGFSLRSLGLRKGIRSGPRSQMPASRSCEELDGPLHVSECWKRSHSLGDIQWQHVFDQSKEKRIESHHGGEKQKEANVSILQSSTQKSEEFQLDLKTNSCRANQAEQPLVPSQLPLKPLFNAPDKQPGFVPTSPAPRTHPKKPPVPPPVPAKKSKERLVNGLRHPSLVLPGSTPGTPTISSKPISSPSSPSESIPSTSVSPDDSEKPPPWLCHLPESACPQIQGVKTALGRKISHAKMTNLETILEEKLCSEGIDLMTEPYSDKHGRCGIPQLLVQRYSEDLQQPLKDVAATLDQIRVKQLRKEHRMAIPSGGLTDMCRKPVSPMHLNSISDWLVSIGMPMYSDLLQAAGFDTLSRLSALTEASVREAGVQEERHVRRLLSEAQHIAANGVSQT